MRAPKHAKQPAGCCLPRSALLLLLYWLCGVACTHRHPESKKATPTRHPGIITLSLNERSRHPPKRTLVTPFAHPFHLIEVHMGSKAPRVQGCREREAVVKTKPKKQVAALRQRCQRTTTPHHPFFLGRGCFHTTYPLGGTGHPQEEEQGDELKFTRRRASRAALCPKVGRSEGTTNLRNREEQDTICFCSHSLSFPLSHFNHLSFPLFLHPTTSRCTPSLTPPYIHQQRSSTPPPPCPHCHPHCPLLPPLPPSVTASPPQSAVNQSSHSSPSPPPPCLDQPRFSFRTRLPPPASTPRPPLCVCRKS